MNKAKKWAFLTDKLPYGKSHAVLGKDLQKALKISERALYLLIQNAREDGVVICASNNGYFLPETIEEMLSYYELAHKRAVTSLTTLKTIRKELVSNGVKVK